MKYLYIYIICIFGTLLSSCKSKKESFISPEVYYWQTSFVCNEADQKNWSDIGIKTICLRFFDVVLKDSLPMPDGEMVMKNAWPANIQLEPVVYVDYRCLYKINKAEAFSLGQKIRNRVEGIAKANSLQFNRLQLDCDWTLNTREKWFEVLKGAKKGFANEDTLPIRAAIRLHQLAYPDQAGIPPADRAILMLYNWGKPGKIPGKNSIFSEKEIEKYIQKANPYPLPLDGAVPLFSWGVLVRQGIPVRLLNGLKYEDIQNYAVKNGADFICSDAFEWQGERIVSGDRIRLEGAEPKDCKNAARLFMKITNSNAYSLCIFDHQKITHYGTEQIRQVFTNP